MGVLKADEIQRLHEAIISTGLAERRAALLAGVHTAFVATLPSSPAPGDQVLLDLHTLNDAERLADGSVPLAMWIRNARALAGPRAEGAIFAALLQRCGAEKRMLPDAPIGDSGVSRSLDDATALIKTRLPRILARHVYDLRPVLVRADVPTGVHTEGSPLDQWTYICEWLAASGVPGIVWTIKIINEVQATNFSDALSRWAADLIEALLQDEGGGCEWGSIVDWLKRFTVDEAKRWDRLRRQIEILEVPVSAESLQYVATSSAIWQRIAAMMGKGLPSGPSSATGWNADLLREH